MGAPESAPAAAPVAEEAALVATPEDGSDAPMETTSAASTAAPVAARSVKVASKELSAAKKQLGGMGGWLVEHGVQVADLPTVDGDTPATYDWLLQRIESKGGGGRKGGESDEHLVVRALLHGERRSRVRILAQVLGRVSSADLRDNRLADQHACAFAEVLGEAAVLAKLSLAGNRITAAGMHALALAVGAAKCSLMELDLSRNPLCRAPSADDDAAGGERPPSPAKLSAPSDATGLAELGKTVALSTTLRTLTLSKGGLGNEGAMSFLAAVAEHAPAPVEEEPAPQTAAQKLMGAKAVVAKPKMAPPPSPMLATLDLSGNNLTVGFTDALATALPVCHTLNLLNLSGNNLGVDGGRAVARAITVSPSLKILDLSETNLCGCSPAHVTTPTREWNGEAVLALSEALLNGAVLNKMILHGNELCGQWSEHVAGEQRTLGAYTTSAVDALIEGLRRERVTLKRDGIRAENNNLRVVDEKRIQQALIENERLPKKVAAVASASMAKPAASFKQRADVSSKEGAQADEASAPKAEGAEKEERRPRRRTKEGGDSFGSRRATKEDADGADEAFAGSVLDAADAEAALSEAAMASEAHEDEAEAADGVPSAVPSAEAASLAPMTLEGGKGEGGAGSPPAKKPAPSKPKTVKVAAPKSDPKQKPADPASDEGKKKERESMSHRTGGKGEGKKKKKEEVVEEEVDPLADLPLMVAVNNLQVRISQEVDSDKIEGESKVPAGALMRIIEEVEFVTGITKLITKRLKVVLDGDLDPLGWVTGVTSENVENVRLANAGFPLMRAAKVLICREGPENKDKKLNDIPRHQMLRVIEKSVRYDGVVKVRALDCT